MNQPEHSSVNSKSPLILTLGINEKASIGIVSSGLAVSAGISAIFYVIPHLFPFLSPGKRSAANHTDLGGQVLFFYTYRHGNNNFKLSGVLK